MVTTRWPSAPGAHKHQICKFRSWIDLRLITSMICLVKYFTMMVVLGPLLSLQTYKYLYIIYNIYIYIYRNSYTSLQLSSGNLCFLDI